MPGKQPIADGYLDEVFTPPKTGTEEDSLFPLAGGNPRKRSSTSTRSGRTKKKVSSTVQVTLEPDQAAFLDLLARKLRRAGERKVNRERVLETILDAIEESGLDPEQLDSLGALRETILNREGSQAEQSCPILGFPMNMFRPMFGGTNAFFRFFIGKR